MFNFSYILSSTYLFIFILYLFSIKNYYGYVLKYYTEENMPMVIKIYMNNHLCYY